MGRISNIEWNTIVEDCKKWDGYDLKVIVIKEEEVKMHRVGRNTTHEFWIGRIDDGRAVVQSIGQCFHPFVKHHLALEMWPNQVCSVCGGTGIETTTTIRENLYGAYLGHF